LLPAFTARGVPNLLGPTFAFAVAPAARENMRPPCGEWRRVLIYGVLSYGVFAVFTTLSRVSLDA